MPMPRTKSTFSNIFPNDLKNIKKAEEQLEKLEELGKGYLNY